jgi:hypothetical protein
MDQSLDRKKNRIDNGVPSFENPLEVGTNRFDEKRHDNNKEPSLNGICAHVTFCESNTDATRERPPQCRQHLANQRKIVLL